MHATRNSSAHDNLSRESWSILNPQPSPTSLIMSDLAKHQLSSTSSPLSTSLLSAPCQTRPNHQECHQIRSRQPLGFVRPASCAIPVLQPKFRDASEVFLGTMTSITKYFGTVLCSANLLGMLKNRDDLAYAVDLYMTFDWNLFSLLSTTLKK